MGALRGVGIGQRREIIRQSWYLPWNRASLSLARKGYFGSRLTAVHRLANSERLLRSQFIICLQTRHGRKWKVELHLLATSNTIQLPKCEQTNTVEGSGFKPQKSEGTSNRNPFYNKASFRDQTPNRCRLLYSTP